MIPRARNSYFTRMLHRFKRDMAMSPAPTMKAGRQGDVQGEWMAIRRRSASALTSCSPLQGGNFVEVRPPNPGSKGLHL